jgi:uncharacterized membrane protein
MAGLSIQPPMNPRKVAIIATLASLALATNYAMLPLHNVKLMDVIVFVGGFCFGPLVGGLIGVLSWAIYGTLNPAGFSFPVWLATMFAEAIYGVVGGIVKKGFSFDSGDSEHRPQGLYFSFSALGMLLTLAYDIVTNVVFGYVSNWDILVSIIAGFVPFGFVHMLSNAFFFGLGSVPAINAIFKVVGGETSGISKK